MHEHPQQNATAYTGLTTGHGATCGHYNVQYNTVAVKKKTNNAPVIPFGAIISLKSPLYLDGVGISKTALTVTDTGIGTGLSSCWIDVYYGASNTINKLNAAKFGMSKIVSYSARY